MNALGNWRVASSNRVSSELSDRTRVKGSGELPPTLASTCSKSFWNVVVSPSVSHDCQPSERLTSRDLYGQISAVNCQAVSTTMRTPCESRLSRSDFGTRPQMMPNTSDSTFIEYVDVPQGDNLERPDSFSNHSCSERQFRIASPDSQSSLPSQIALRSKPESRSLRYQRLYSCAYSKPLRIGNDNRLAREVVEQICHWSALPPDGKERLLRLIRGFEHLYQIPKAAKGIGGSFETSIQRRLFREGVTGLLLNLSDPGWQDQRYKNIDKRLSELERKARALRIG